MTNYTITQSRKGGRATAAQSRRHDDAIIHRLLTDGYATQETSKLVARKVDEVKRELLDWNTEDALRIHKHFAAHTPEAAEEWCESAEWNYDAIMCARKRDWLAPEMGIMMDRAIRWVLTMRKVHSAVQLVEALRKSNYQRVEA
jgi:hypothetical protein